jgi:phospholipid/cholesterol/gamma-HCH transport system substrate-binding protein
MRKLALSVALCLPLLVMAGCAGGGSSFTATARFADVADLAPHAPVMMADIKIGEVTAIRLDHDQALVTMKIERSARVPRDVLARVRRTSLLGERILDLVPPANLPANAPLLGNGMEIRNTEVRPDLEDLVQAGNAVLQPITASEVATLVDEGYKGFGGRGQDLRGFLDNLNQIAAAYVGKTGEIQSLITSLNQFNTTVAKDASAQGLSLQNSDRALTMLDEESGQLKAAIHDLARLAQGSRAILDQHSDEMNHFFAQMRVILGVLQQQESDIAGFLAYAPRHDYNTQVVEFLENNQVFQDFVICGLNDNPKDPARMCPQTSGQSTGGHR